MSIRFDGLASGINTEKIVAELAKFKRQQVETLQGRQHVVETKRAAFTAIELQLQRVQAATASLSAVNNGAFDGRTASSSDTALLEVAAGSAAEPGTYNVRVNRLALSHQVASQGFDSIDSEISQGTFQITSGSQTATVTIDSTNNTLRQFATAIDNAGIGIKANFVDDGSATTSQPTRLLLTAESGTANAITISNTLADSSGTAIKPNFSSSSIGAAVIGTNATGTSIPTANTGPSTYTGASNDTFTFTVTSAGTVGTDEGLQVEYTNIAGDQTGTLTINAADVATNLSVAQGIEVQFSAGTLVAGDTFTIDAFVPNVQDAQDAEVQLGSGTGALKVQDATNVVQGLIPGVTLNLRGVDTSKDVTVVVDHDGTKITGAVREFVDSYNALTNFIQLQTSFDEETQTAGLLSGSVLVQTVQQTLQESVYSVSTTLPSKINRLSPAGISTTDKGLLSFDQSVLQQILTDDHSEISFADLRRMFVMDGQSTNPGIQFVASSSQTLESTTPYEVDLTQVAERAAITATNPLSATTTIDSSNNTFVVRVDGRETGTVTVAAGNYTRAELAAQLEAQINADLSSSGQRVSVTVSGTHLVITSGTYGYASEVTIVSGSGLTDLGFAGSETDLGQDVVGNFVVDGVVETAVGRGQLLVGEVDNANTADLQVLVTLDSSEVQEGAEAELTVTRGVASRVGLTLNSLLDPTSGRLSVIDSSLAGEIEDIEKQIDQKTTAMAEREAALYRQFVALERVSNQSQAQLTLLNRQFGSGQGGGGDK